MTNSLKKEIETIIHSQGLNCPVEKFKKKANWYSLSLCQPLSVEFIEYFIDEVNWNSLYENKKISQEVKQQFSYNFN